MMLKKLTIAGSLVALLSGCSNTIEGLDTDLETAAKARIKLREVSYGTYYLLVEVKKVNGHQLDVIRPVFMTLPSETSLNFQLQCSHIYRNDQTWTNTAVLQQTLEKNMCYKMKVDYNRKNKKKYKHANWGYCELVEFEKIDCSET